MSWFSDNIIANPFLNPLGAVIKQTQDKKTIGSQQDAIDSYQKQIDEYSAQIDGTSSGTVVHSSSSNDQNWIIYAAIACIVMGVIFWLYKNK